MKHNGTFQLFTFPLSFECEQQQKALNEPHLLCIDDEQCVECQNVSNS